MLNVSSENSSSHLNKNEPILKKTLLMKRDNEKLAAINKIFSNENSYKNIKYVPTICLTFKFHKEFYDELYFENTIDKDEFDKLCDSISRILYLVFEKNRNSIKSVSYWYTNLITLVIITLTVLIIVLTVKSINITISDKSNSCNSSNTNSTSCIENDLSYKEESFSSLTIIFGCINILVAIYLIIFKILNSLKPKRVVLLDELMGESINSYLKKYTIINKLLDKICITYNSQYRFIRFEKLC
jgi:hypothetical protein